MEKKKVIEGATNVVINKRSINTVSLITILLIILKVTDNIEISWFWVFAPYWLPICLLLGFICLVIGGVFLFAIGAVLLEAALEWWDKRR